MKAADLERFERAKPVQVQPVGRLKRSWRWCKSNPAVAALLGVVFALLLAGTGLAWALALRAQQSADAVAAARDEARAARNAGMR